MLVVSESFQILQSFKYYAILAMVVMIYTVISGIFALGYLMMKKRYKSLSPLDILTVNFIIICVLFSIVNFAPYFWTVYGRKLADDSPVDEFERRFKKDRYLK